MKKIIQTVEGEAIFYIEVNTIDEAQALIDSYRNQGKEAYCLHKNNKHQVYVV